jgi:hypothetical protein
MHGSLPLARLINGFFQPSPSRIPHLTVHIVRRQLSRRALPELHRPIAQCSPHSRRYSSAAPPITVAGAISDLLTSVSGEQDGTTSQEDVAQKTESKRSAPQTRTLTTMEELLEENHPERILLGLVTAQIGGRFIMTAEDEDFSRAFCALDPEYFVVPYRHAHRHLSHALESRPKYRIVRSFEERTGSFMTILDTVVTLRQEAGHRVTLDVYRHLLKCAASGGMGSFARNVFLTQMPAEGIEPDLACYNHFMNAISWNEAYGRYERQRLQVMGRNMAIRAEQKRPLGWQGHGVASPNRPDNPDSIRQEVLGHFNGLVSRGMSGDEDTFCVLMVAMAREGDISSVKSVLKSVWNVDVDGLNQYDEEELESPTFYEEGSPLRPTTRLLATVVHVFGINNEVAVGGLLLDYISRMYSLEIPEHVWTELLEWTFVLSNKRASSLVEPGFGTGRIDLRAVDSVYHVFHSEPYNVKPQIVDLILRIRARVASQSLQEVLEDLRTCMELLDERRTHVAGLFRKLRQWLQGPESDQVLDDGVPCATFLALRREYVLQSIYMDRDIQLILIAIRRFFKVWKWNHQETSFDYVHRDIPKLVDEWRAWLPNIIPYYTVTGHVRIWARQDRHAALKAANRVQTTRNAFLRTLLDTISPARLRHAVTWLHLSHGQNAIWLDKFEEEVANDAEGHHSDWVLRTEQRLRQERLAAPDLPMAGVGPDRKSEQWWPWGIDPSIQPSIMQQMPDAQEQWELNEEADETEQLEVEAELLDEDADSVDDARHGSQSAESIWRWEDAVKKRR